MILGGTSTNKMRFCKFNIKYHFVRKMTSWDNIRQGQVLCLATYRMVPLSSNRPKTSLQRLESLCHSKGFYSTLPSEKTRSMDMTNRWTLLSPDCSVIPEPEQQLSVSPDRSPVFWLPTCCGYAGCGDHCVMALLQHLPGVKM